MITACTKIKYIPHLWPNVYMIQKSKGGVEKTIPVFAR